MRLPWIILTALALATLPAYAQTNSPTSTLQVYSRETVVDVTVTDAKGQPVHNLQQSDFTVEEDGKPQSIRSFKEFGTEARPVQTVLPKLPPGVYSNAGAVPLTGPVNIFLLDALNTEPDSVVIWKRDLIAYLKTMPAGTQVAIFGLSLDKGGYMLQSFTMDGSAAATAVAAFDPDYTRHPVLAIALNLMTIEALERVGAYVSGVKGRKNLMWLTSNMRIHILRDGGFNEGDPPPDGIPFARIAALYDRLTEEQVAVFPVNANGKATQAQASLGDNGSLVSDFRVNYPLVEESVAEGTGGVAIYNTNDLKSAIAKAVDNGSNFYTLTYVPPPFANDSRLRTIDIKVDRPGLHLVYRKGYNAVDPSNIAPSAGPSLMQAAMGGGAPPATQLLFDVRVQPSTEPVKPTDPPVIGTLDPKLRKAALTRYSLLYLLPVRQIAFADAPDGVHSGSLEFDVVAFDADNKKVTMLSQTIDLPLSAGEYQQFLKTPFQFFQQIDLPPGQFTLRIGILDGTSNKIGTLEIPLTVTKPAAE